MLYFYFIKMKCFYSDCKKPINLTSIKCKCENIFCSLHRLPESHNCNFNYKLNIINKLKINNPKIIDKKIETF